MSSALVKTHAGGASVHLSVLVRMLTRISFDFLRLDVGSTKKPSSTALSPLLL